MALMTYHVLKSDSWITVTQVAFTIEEGNIALCHPTLELTINFTTSAFDIRAGSSIQIPVVHICLSLLFFTYLFFPHFSAQHQPTKLHHT